MEVPAMKSMGISFSSRALITPMWASPLAPPPLKTSPTFCALENQGIISDSIIKKTRENILSNFSKLMDFIPIDKQVKWKSEMHAQNSRSLR
jgi:hypothetical protein